MPPVQDEDLGNGDEGDARREVSRELAQNFARVTSTGFVRGQMKSLSVVRGGAQPKMMAAYDHDEHYAHDPDGETALEGGMVAAALGEIRAGVIEAVGAVAGNPVGDAMNALGSHFVQRAEAAAAKAGRAREAQAKLAAEARMKGYEGDACGTCGNFTLVRNGTCMKCNTCGSTSGCS